MIGNMVILLPRLLRAGDRKLKIASHPTNFESATRMLTMSRNCVVILFIIMNLGPF